MTSPQAPFAPTLTLDLVTPENVPVPFEVASLGQRVLALLLDFLIMGLVLVGMWFALLLMVVATGLAGADYLVAIVILLSFFVRNFYFAWSELRWQGQTIGKRKLGLRVVARDGGPLTAPMVFARNLTRELEIFLPIAALYAPELLVGEDATWTRVGLLAWVGVLALLPAFNRQRARLGDLVAGTVVVVAPSARLLPDLVDARPLGRPHPATDFVFTREQLEIYGIKELQVLEQVLRRDIVPPELVIDIAERIKRKIGWDPRRWNVPPEPFLRAFYASQRSRLEQKMLMGKRQERKRG